MLLDDFDICLIFLSLNKYDPYHVVLEALETNVNIGIISALSFVYFFLETKVPKIVFYYL